MALGLSSLPTGWRSLDQCHCRELRYKTSLTRRSAAQTVTSSGFQCSGRHRNIKTLSWVFYEHRGILHGIRGSVYLCGFYTWKAPRCCFSSSMYISWCSAQVVQEKILASSSIRFNATAQVAVSQTDLEWLMRTKKYDHEGLFQTVCGSLTFIIPIHLETWIIFHVVLQTTGFMLLLSLHGGNNLKMRTWLSHGPFVLFDIKTQLVASDVCVPCGYFCRCFVRRHAFWQKQFIFNLTFWLNESEIKTEQKKVLLWDK